MNTLGPFSVLLSSILSHPFKDQGLAINTNIEPITLFYATSIPPHSGIQIDDYKQMVNVDTDSLMIDGNIPMTKSVK